MSQPVTLGYWNIRGLAERIRLVLQYLQIPYEQVIFTPEDQKKWFAQLKPQYLKKNPAANLPYLQDGDKLICQSQAIIVYLCHKANRKDLLGQNCDEQTQVATVMGVYRDLAKSFSGYCYGDKPYEEIKTSAITNLKPSIDKLKGLLENKEWFAGRLTYCDFIVGDFFQVYSLFDENFTHQYPALKAHQERMWQLDGVKEYVKSDRFKERPINWYPEAKWY